MSRRVNVAERRELELSRWLDQVETEVYTPERKRQYWAARRELDALREAAGVPKSR